MLSMLNTVVEVWNKIDRLDEDALHRVSAARASLADPASAHLVSAVTGEGTGALLADTEQRIAGHLTGVSLDVGPDAMNFIPWLYDNATVTEREDGEDGVVHLKAEMTAQARAELRRIGESTPGITIGG